MNTVYYTLEYKTGGTLNTKWNPVLERFNTYAGADAIKQGLEQMGFEAIILTNVNASWQSLNQMDV